MRYAERMDRPLSDDDRRWLKENNFGHVADQFDSQDGAGIYAQIEEVTEPRDYSKMTVDQLREEITRRNGEILAEDPDAEPMSAEGKKSELILRLKEDDAAIAEAAESDDE